MSWMSAKPKVRVNPLKATDLVHSKRIVLARKDRASLNAKTLLTFREKSLSEFSSCFNEMRISAISGDKLSTTHLDRAGSMSYVMEDVVCLWAAVNH